MDNINEIENISILNELFNQGSPKHPMISIIDFSTVDFENLKQYNEQKVSMGFYTILLKKLSAGSLKYGRKNSDFQEGSLFFSSPNQMLTIENPILEDCQYNWGLFFHNDLIYGTSLFEKMKQYKFFDYNNDEVLHLSEDEKESLTLIINAINKEINNSIDKHTKPVIASAIELLLNHSLRYYDRQFITRVKSNNMVISVFETYLKNYFESDMPSQKGLPTVNQCAQKLNLSPNYLTDLLKKETGKNTQEHIHYYLLEHAKNQLLNSDKPVSQIAYSLGFEYPQYFSTIFKKKVGLSPSKFRNTN